MPSIEDRERRYVTAIRTVPGVAPTDVDYARAVMAVADAEQAELRAKVARVEELADAYDRIIGDSSAARSIRDALGAGS